MAKLTNRIIKKTSSIKNEFVKSLYHINKKYDTKIIFLMGCQRSGTSLTSDIFNTNRDIKVFKEMKGVLTSEDTLTKIRLNPIDKLRKTFNKYSFPALLAKPLVESHKALLYLEAFPELKIIWLFRNYYDVAASNIKHFGDNNGHKNLKPIFDDVAENWRNEKLSPKIIDFVNHFELSQLSPYEAAALFWWVRNQIFFDQGLELIPRVKLCRYESIVNEPIQTFESLYEFIGIELKDRKPLKTINKNALGRGRNVELHPTIKKECETLYQKLADA